MDAIRRRRRQMHYNEGRDVGVRLQHVDIELQIQISRLEMQDKLMEDTKAAASDISKRSGGVQSFWNRPYTFWAATCLYAACKQTGEPRSLDEIAESSGWPKIRIAAAYKALMRRLDAPARRRGDPADFLEQQAEMLQADSRVRDRAMELLRTSSDRAPTAFLADDPRGVSAAALWRASSELGYRNSQRWVARVTRVSDVTIRKNAYKFSRILEG